MDTQISDQEGTGRLHGCKKDANMLEDEAISNILTATKNTDEFINNAKSLCKTFAQEMN